MPSTLFPQLTDPMPPWHYQQTFHLTAAAAENPMLLVQEFFQCYSLHDIRYCLHEWLHKSVQQNEVDSDLFTLHDTVIRLVEASWLLWKESMVDGQQSMVMKKSKRSLVDGQQSMVRKKKGGKRKKSSSV